MKMHQCVPLFFAISGFAVFAPIANAQTAVASRTSSPIAEESSSITIKRPLPELVYEKPTEKMKLHAYIFDAYGPYPIAGAAFVAGISQAGNSPPEWGQGASAYAQRFGSNLAIAAVTTTTRYGLAEAFREDTLYYRCECKGFFRRLEHAMISTVTARRGENGSPHISLSAIVSPYVGTFTAVYAWYPERYGPKDALRMGNYNLLAFGGENIALEFIYGGPHTLFSHIHRPGSSGADSTSASNH